MVYLKDILIIEFFGPGRRQYAQAEFGLTSSYLVNVNSIFQSLMYISA